MAREIFDKAEDATEKLRTSIDRCNPNAVALSMKSAKSFRICISQSWDRYRRVY